MTTTGRDRRFNAVPPEWIVALVALLPRLPLLGLPVASWRDADTAAIARNFARDGMDLLRPTVDWTRGGSGLIECEFPLYSFLVAVGAMAGLDIAFAGRLLSVAFSVGAAVVFARLAARHVGAWPGAWAAVAFTLFPVSLTTGAAVMPEALMLFATTVAMDRMDVWSRGGAEHHRWIAVAALATAILVKLPEAFLGIPFAFLVWRRFGWSFLRRGSVWASAALAILPAIAWYGHARSLGAESGLTFGIWEAGSDKWANWGLLVDPEFHKTMFLGRFVERHFTYAGFVLLLVGWWRLRHRRDLGTFVAWIAGAFFYLAVVAKGNRVHAYYQLPILLPLSLGVGVAIDAAWRERVRWRRVGLRVLVAGFVVLALARSGDHARTSWRSGAAMGAYVPSVQAVVPRDALTITLDDGNPRLLYRLDRRGWRRGHVDIEWLEARRAEGARRVVAPAARVSASELEFLRTHTREIEAGDGVFVFDLDR